MKTCILRVGNVRGIRIPRALLDPTMPTRFDDVQWVWR